MLVALCQYYKPFRLLPLSTWRIWKYMENNQTSNATTEKDINNWIKAALLRKENYLRESSVNLTLKTKLMVYHAVVLSTLLYACQTWVL